LGHALRAAAAASGEQQDQRSMEGRWNSGRRLSKEYVL
jgi:hypothetical protein